MLGSTIAAILGYATGVVFLLFVFKFVHEFEELSDEVARTGPQEERGVPELRPRHA